MNWVDVAIVVLLVWSIVSGFSTGLIREAFAVVAFVVGFYAAARFATFGASFLTSLPSPEIARIVAFVGIFLVIVFLVRSLADVIHQVSSFLLLGWLDQAGGVLFGFGKGIVISEVCLIIGVNLPLIDSGIKESKLAATLMSYLPSLLLLLPKDFQFIQQFFH